MENELLNGHGKATVPHRSPVITGQSSHDPAKVFGAYGKKH